MRQLSDHFWNFRGTFRIGKVLNVGTQMSLVRRQNGTFLLIDSYRLEPEDHSQLLSLTQGGAAIEAILNVHPFHTLHCEAISQAFPHARLYGTQRHRERAPHLDWQSACIEAHETQRLFEQDLAFSIPAGLDLVTDNESVHAGSVLVRHKPSGIVHVDDTFNVLRAPGFVGSILPQSRLRFHPMLPKALQKRAGAAVEFRRWAQEIAHDWAGAPYVCTAHSAVRQLGPSAWQEEVLKALSDVDKTLEKHRSRYG